MRNLLVCLLALSNVICLSAQTTQAKNPVYIDSSGVLRWTKDQTEASFFGVNYTTPFAHAYRAQKALGINLKEAIRQDVYHFARMGLDAFRVHVWDTEISDSLGNLIDNEHLQLFDFLLAELAFRKIKTIITPIAFWGNGYPDRDEKTPGFSRKYGKEAVTVNDTAIRAQENYLKQFFTHINPYTRKSYQDDPIVLAVELNNEPSHSGPKKIVTDYINRLAAAVRQTGWTKPVYYNISQGPYYADAVAQSIIDGVSFQWYPTGLVANQELKGNSLPNVDRYTIPFDTIPMYRTKSKMVYEFDAADVLQSYLYPAIARSFREAGFQWATQFSYDPMALADVNTEYQTHYLNLAYTPSKAIGLMIAAEAFRRLPRGKNYGRYPADSLFDVFRVSYRNDLSEMNAVDKFYHSNPTQTKPLQLSKLKSIAGVGSSSLVKYRGTGAYFLDKMDEGVWRLELMPDVVRLSDPFDHTSKQKTVARIQWQTHNMKLMLPGLGKGFSIIPVNKGNSFYSPTKGYSFSINPGTYLLVSAGKGSRVHQKNAGVVAFNEFVAPPATEEKAGFTHQKINQEVVASSGRLVLFDPSLDRNISTYPVFNQNFRNFFLNENEQKFLHLSVTEFTREHTMGFQHFIGDRIRLSTKKFNTEDVIFIQAKALETEPLTVKITLMDKDAVSVSATITLSKEFKEMQIPLKNFTPDSALLLPRPYPDFMPLRFQSAGMSIFKIADVEKLQITVGSELPASEYNKKYGIEIGIIGFKKKGVK